MRRGIKRFLGYRFKIKRIEDNVVVSKDFEKETRDFLMSIRGNVFLDIGAFNGFYSIILSPNFKKIIAFEPEPYNFSITVENVLLNGLEDKVSVFPIAISDQDGITDLYIHYDQSCHSIVKKSPMDKSYKVLTMRLDTFLNRYGISAYEVDLVKIDVEGAEIKVLEGARGLLSFTDAIFVIEATNETIGKVTKIMKEYGYELTKVLDRRKGYEGEFANYVFEYK